MTYCTRFDVAKLFLLVAILFISFTSFAHAQEFAGVGLSPTLIEKGADPGQVIIEELRVSNLSQTQQTYYLFTKDITGVRAAGNPIFADEGAEKTGYELSEWVSLSTTEVTLAPGADEPVQVTINVPESATPGSHFGGIFVSLEPPRLRTVGAGVGFEVANIVSIRISGDAVESAQIRTFSTDKLIYGTTDVTFEARVENKGNVLVRPYGPLVVTNMFGKQVAVMTFNESLGGVFPGTIRDFKLQWEDVGPAFGRYEARVSLVYGETGVSQSTITSNVSFWVLPMNIVKPAAITLGILLLLTYVGIKLYVRNKMLTVQSMGSRRVSRGRRGNGTSLLATIFVVMLAVTAFFLLILLVLFA